MPCAFAVAAGVTRCTWVHAMVDGIRRRRGKVKVIVNNGAVQIGRRTLADMTEEYWDRMMTPNLKSAFQCAKAVWDGMAAAKSWCIVNISSATAVGLFSNPI